MNSSLMMSLGRADRGQFVERADAQLREVVRAVRQHGGKGKVVVTIAISPNGSGRNGALQVDFDAKSTIPQPKSGSSFYWAGEEGALDRKPPEDEMDQMFDEQEIPRVGQR